MECRKLACERDGRILFQDLDFTVDEGSLMQIEGPNGCGKTTLLRALVSLFPDITGQILWRGSPIDKNRYEFLFNLLFLGHLPGIKKNLTPRENLRFLSSLHQTLSIENIDQALEKVGLYGYEDVPGYRLSAGQLRRIALARLHLSSANLWILDEPFTAIDQQGVANLETLLLKHTRAGGSVIFTTHQASSLKEVHRLSLVEYLPTGTRSMQAGHADA
ncbi:MAG: heme exporter protein A [Cellvibrionaceae bacterium]